MSEDDKDGRRRFLAKGARVAAGVGLAASYGTFGAFAVRFLYPAKDQPTLWVFVADVAGFARGASLPFTAPGGAKVAIARQGGAGSVDDFVALSSTCPHLGCQVHWQAAEQQFFCPCHNGAFDASGRATAGPPAKAGQSLLRYPLKIEDGLLYVQVPAPDPTEGERANARRRRVGV
ncbi:MAG: ubiquinol-cytochrome c reductase iron-sulfur subunit [Deltaproteobacteria bacterium]|nr:ubiquinol-cytochrome c reductase iron-sulfur subunit [Deltaproteobacteria bacterium]